LAKKEDLTEAKPFFDTCTYTRAEVQRLAKKGFELAMTRTKKNYVVLTANVLETVYGEKQYKPWKRHPEVTKLRICRCGGYVFGTMA
jgi:3-isopropylmalate dehydrogenase